MALIACPECLRQVSDRATTCPECGYPLGIALPPAPAVEPTPVAFAQTARPRSRTLARCRACGNLVTPREVTSLAQWIAGLFVGTVLAGVATMVAGEPWSGLVGLPVAFLYMRTRGRKLARQVCPICKSKDLIFFAMPSTDGGATAGDDDSPSASGTGAQDPRPAPVRRGLRQAFLDGLEKGKTREAK